MNATQAMKYMSQLPGVEGCFIASTDGNIIGSDMPAMFDNDILSEIASGSANTLETFKAEISDCQELKLSMELKTLYVREAASDLMILLVDDSENFESIRVAANVAVRRYQPAANMSNNNSGHQSASLTPSRNEDSSDQTISITDSIFGTRGKKKKAEPQEEDDSIWG